MLTIREMCAQVGVSLASYHRYVEEREPIAQERALRDALQRMGLWNAQKSLEEYVSASESISSFVPPLLATNGGVESRPRNFSLLLFGHDVTRFVPGAFIVFSVYRGKDRSEPTAEKREITGSVLEQARKVIEQLTAEAYVAFDKSTSNPNQTKYPVRALQEAAMNAIVHRDYEIDQPVRITVFSDRIEIVSPGALPRAIDADRFKNGKAAPFWRNQSLAYFFSKLQFAQAEGQGIPTILRTMKEEGCPDPSFEIEPERITCTLPAHPRHAMLREIQAIENKIIIGRFSDAQEQLVQLLQHHVRSLAVERRPPVARAHAATQIDRTHATFRQRRHHGVAVTIGFENGVIHASRARG